MDIYKCPSHRMGNLFLKSRWMPHWDGAVLNGLFHLLTIRIFVILDRRCLKSATKKVSLLKTALKMQWYFTRYYFPLHNSLLVLSNNSRQNRQKRVSVKIGFSIKNMQSLSSGKNQVIFSRKKRIFVGYPLTSCFRFHYYNAGLIFGHL